jgi:hypothetical protein
MPKKGVRPKGQHGSPQTVPWSLLVLKAEANESAPSTSASPSSVTCPPSQEPTKQPTEDEEVGWASMPDTPMVEWATMSDTPLTTDPAKLLQMRQLGVAKMGKGDWFHPIKADIQYNIPKKASLVETFKHPWPQYSSQQEADRKATKGVLLS